MSNDSEPFDPLQALEHLSPELLQILRQLESPEVRQNLTKQQECHAAVQRWIAEHPLQQQFQLSLESNPHFKRALDALQAENPIKRFAATVHQARVIDGRNRLRAMEAVGIEIKAESCDTGGGPSVDLWHRCTTQAANVFALSTTRSGSLARCA